MAKEKFIHHKFNRASLELVATANSILDDYAGQGYRLSLRQVYYQFVARDLFPEDRRWAWINNKWVRDPNGTKNATPNYKWLGEFVSTARLAGLLDWDMLEDRGRDAVIPSAWTSPAEIVRAAAQQFRVDRWAGQTNYCEVMVEKDALSGILGPVCRELHVRFTANKGYSSSSAMYEAGGRIYNAMTDSEKGINQVHIFYLGDHDPSGIDMTRDITDRLFLFSKLKDRIEDAGDGDGYGLDDFIHIHRLALNMDQVKLWSPPENPAKETDSRFEAYREEFGKSSWELDAVEPKTLAELVREGIEDLIDWDIWKGVQAQETKMREELERFASDYGKPKKSKGKK